MPEALRRNPLWMWKRCLKSEPSRIPIPLMDAIVVTREGAEVPAAGIVNPPVSGGRRRFVENG